MRPLSRDNYSVYLVPSIKMSENSALFHVATLCKLEGFNFPLNTQTPEDDLFRNHSSAVRRLKDLNPWRCLDTQFYEIFSDVKLRYPQVFFYPEHQRKALNDLYKVTLWSPSRFVSLGLSYQESISFEIHTFLNIVCP